MENILFLRPDLKERLWGGTWLNSFYEHKEPDDPIGEAWVVSGHPNGPSTIKGGSFDGVTFDRFFTEHKDVFPDIDGDRFPLMIKIIDAGKDLSVQVHPDDRYAEKHEDDRGKSEAWYIWDTDGEARLVLGHHATSRAELKAMIEENRYEDLLKKVDVKSDDFVHIPAGTLHAIGAGVRLVEVQLSSDLTYRVYDYDRTDDDGNPRELHVEKALDVIDVPGEDITVSNHAHDRMRSVLHDGDDFKLKRIRVSGKMLWKPEDRTHVCIVTDGSGAIGGTPVSAGDGFVVLPKAKKIGIKGQLTFMAAHAG